MIDKYRAEKRKYDDKGLQTTDSELLGDHHPHCLLVIEGAQELFSMASSKVEYLNDYRGRVGTGESPFREPLSQTRNRAHDYLDELILRLVPGSDEWFRNHFPVVIETNKTHYFGEKIYDQINLHNKTFPTIEFGNAMEGGGIPQALFTERDKIHNLKHIFNADQVKMMIDKVGRSIYFTHVFTELAKVRSENENFKDLLKLDVSNLLKTFNH